MCVCHLITWRWSGGEGKGERVDDRDKEGPPGVPSFLSVLNEKGEPGTWGLGSDRSKELWADSRCTWNLVMERRRGHR